MVQVVTVINFKGGMGKTTCAVEIAVSLARHYGRRTLLVDMDPQASATFYVMEQEHWKWWRSVHGTTYDLFEHTGEFISRIYHLRALKAGDVMFEADELHISYPTRIKKDDLVAKILTRSACGRSEQYAIQEV